MTSSWSMFFLLFMLTSGLDYVSANFKRICYFSIWSQNRRDLGYFTPENIDPYLCTHIIIAFAKVEGNSISVLEDKDEYDYARVVQIKRENPLLKVLLGVGGWVHGTAPFTAIVQSKSNMDNFADNVIRFLRTRDFDGLDLDWEYPGSRGSPPGDKQKFTQFVHTLREAFEKEAAHAGRLRLLLTAAVPASRSVVQAGYEVGKISKDLDIINLMTYDLHGSWDSTLGHNSPLYSRIGEQWYQATLNQDWGVKHWVSKGAPKEKLMLGIAAYGRTFQTVNGTSMGDPAVGPGKAGKYTDEAGFLAYYEVCENLKSGWTRKWHSEHKVPYGFLGDQWVGYDDVRSVQIKANYIKDQDLGGAMVWSMDLDDFRGLCGQGSFPLLQTIRDTLSSNNSAEATKTLENPGVVPYMPKRHNSDSTLSQETQAHEYKRVCYYTNWSQYRASPMTFLPEDLDPRLCTHIIYSFGKLAENDIHTSASNDIDFYRRVLRLKKINPNLVVLLAIGGWSHGSMAFSSTVSTPKKIFIFAKRASKYLRRYKFDGLDLNWEFPASRGSPSLDKYRFTSLLKALQQEFQKESTESGLPRLILTAAVSAIKPTIDAGYEIQKIGKYVDFLNLMAYDLRGSWDHVTGHNSPLYSEDHLSQDFAVKYWMNNGVPREKIVLGLGFYGRSFTLTASGNHSIGVPTVGPGKAQPYTKTEGFMAYFEVCTWLKTGWTQVWSASASAPYAYSGNQWVGYDDEQSIAIKAEYIRSNRLGGGMVWSADMDDYRNVCGNGKYPLLKKLKVGLDSTVKDLATAQTSRIVIIPTSHAATTIGVPTRITTIRTPTTTRPTTTTAPTITTTSIITTTPVFTPIPTTTILTSTPTPTTTSSIQTVTLFSLEYVSSSNNCGPPADCPTGQYIADTCNASLYYQCNHGIAIALVCPPGLNWDADGKYCDWPRVQKGIKDNKVGSTRIDQCKPSSCPDGTLVPDPCDPSCYFSCAGFGSSRRACCTEGTVWDAAIRNCNWIWAMS